MRLRTLGVVAAVLAAFCYFASPFWVAWAIRDAVKSSDTEYLARKVEWESVRSSLKASIAAHTQLVPEISRPEELPKPGLWQRVKMALGQSMIDNFVDSYITPEGLPKLHKYRQTYEHGLQIDLDEEEAGLSGTERFKRFWNRLKRAEFQSLSRLEIELESKRTPARRYVAVMEFRDFGWRLTGLSIIAAPQPAAAPVAEMSNPALGK